MGWTGTFDSAADVTGAAARHLDSLEYGDCWAKYDPGPKATPEEISQARMMQSACERRFHATKHAAAQAFSIERQQDVMSVVSKASDVAALGAVGATIYAEMGVKDDDQASTYDKAAHIQKTAGTVNYVAGASDLAMGAYAYVAHKNRLEHIRSDVTGGFDGVQASSDPAVAASLTAAAEASKQAAYNHMIYGAGKMVAGYATMKLAKRSKQQADNMRTLDENEELRWLAARKQQQTAANTQYVVVGSSDVPFYTNNTPVFTVPNTGNSLGTGFLSSVPQNFAATGSGLSGGSSLSGASRGPASSVSAGKSAGGGAGGGGGQSAGASGASSDPEASVQAAKEKATREAMGATGSSFEASLSGGIRSYTGSGSPGGVKEETPNLSAMMGGMGPGGKNTAATGLSPAQVYSDALEGTEGTEQGSMAGVNAKRDSSLFEITKSKLTKMFQVGNVGFPKDVEVKN
jgi:hypothetical protein